MIKSFLDLEVYKLSFQLSLEIEDIIKTFPKSEQYLLADQMRRASRAIPALISEGYAKRESIKEFNKFLRDGIGEDNEMINHLAFAQARKYINYELSQSFIQRYIVLGKMLYNLKDNWKQY